MKLPRASLFSDAFVQPASAATVLASLLVVGVTMFPVAGQSVVQLGGLTTIGGTTGPSNKELKLTKPGELRSFAA